MKGLIVVEGADGRPDLQLADVPQPEAGGNELLVRVVTSGLNRADIALASDHYSGHSVAGSELAGQVVAVGNSCAGFALGDRVMALSRGSLAEYAAVDHRLAIKIPENMDYNAAAALPAWYMTAHDALVTQGQLKAGENVLIQGATSGVGQASAQLARVFGARHIIGVARSQSKLDRLAGSLLDTALNMQGDWVPAARHATGGNGVDLVIDMVGGGALVTNLESLGIGGRIVAVGRLGGDRDTLDIGLLAFKRARLIGTTFRTRTLEQRVAVARAFADSVLPHVTAGRLEPRIDRVIPLAHTSEARLVMQQNEHFGKILVAIQ